MAYCLYVTFSSFYVQYHFYSHSGDFMKGYENTWEIKTISQKFYLNSIKTDKPKQNKKLFFFLKMYHFLIVF